MRRIKEEVLKTLSKGLSQVELSALNHSPGVHERDEAKKILIYNSFYYNEYYNGDSSYDEIENQVNILISYLEFNNYFYGVSSSPASVIFCENDNKQLECHPLVVRKWTWIEFKKILQKHTPEFVVVNAVVKEGCDWTVRMGFKVGIKLIYDNPEYVELYKPEETETINFI